VEKPQGSTVLLISVFVFLQFAVVIGLLGIYFPAALEQPLTYVYLTLCIALITCIMGLFLIMRD